MSWQAQDKLTALSDRRLIRSLSAFSLAKEDQVNENPKHHCGHDHLLQVFRIKGARRDCPRCGSTMTAMMIDGGKRVAACWARLQWHMIPIADIDLIARNTRGKENGLASSHSTSPELRENTKARPLRRWQKLKGVDKTTESCFVSYPGGRGPGYSLAWTM